MRIADLLICRFADLLTGRFADLRMVMRGLAGVVVVIAVLAIPCSASWPPWQLYTFRDDSFSPLPSSLKSPCPPVSPSPCPLVSPLPPDWRVTASALADVTGDGAPEWVLLVWRPWRDWPTQRWSPVPSPIAGFHDAAGDSCHVILLEPHSGREVWAGSALPAPLLALAVGDADGDGLDELVTLEGDYARGRAGPATRVDVWGWNGFGFTMEWRSPPGTFHQLCLTDVDGSGILDVAVR